jgi:hypothetical protein
MLWNDLRIIKANFVGCIHIDTVLFTPLKGV